MFLEFVKETSLIVFYLTVTYAISLRVLGGLTIKAKWENSTYSTVSYKTKILLTMSILNLIGVPPLPLFWAKAALTSVILSKISTSQLAIIVIFTNLIIILYSTVWARSILQPNPKSISSKKINQFVTQQVAALLIIQTTAPYWLIILL